MTEIWKDVLNYEDQYQVSNLGRIRSKDRLVNTKGNATNSSLERILVHEISHLLRNGEDAAVQDENKVAKQLGENWERKRSDKDRIVDEKK